MPDAAPVATRRIDEAAVEDHYNPDEKWLVITAAGGEWPVKWDRQYGDGIVVALLEYYGLEYSPDPEAVDVGELVGEDLPVRENEHGEWRSVVTDVFRGEAQVGDPPDPIVGASDGPVLILANGQAVRPVLHDAGGTRLHPWSISPEDGESVYGPEVDEYHTRLSFEADPDAADIEAVADRLDAYGFGGGPSE